MPMGNFRSTNSKLQVNVSMQIHIKTKTEKIKIRDFTGRDNLQHRKRNTVHLLKIA